jgi:aspartyl aminopeptidase
MSAASEFLLFVNKGPSPFHAVAEAKRNLLASGFTELKEKSSWQLAAKGRYFFTRNQVHFTIVHHTTY